MGKINDRVSEIAKKCGDLSPLAQPIQKRLWEGNKAVILAGVSPGSTVKVRSLGPWAGPPPTYPKRKGSGPPRAPMGAASRIVAGCEIAVHAGVGRLQFYKSYPSLGPIAEYLHYGTRSNSAKKHKGMPARPFFEFRASDIEWVRNQMKAYIITSGWRTWLPW